MSAQTGSDGGPLEWMNQKPVHCEQHTPKFGGVIVAHHKQLGPARSPACLCNALDGLSSRCRSVRACEDLALSLFVP